MKFFNKKSNKVSAIEMYALINGAEAYLNWLDYKDTFDNKPHTISKANAKKLSNLLYKTRAEFIYDSEYETNVGGSYTCNNAGDVEDLAKGHPAIIVELSPEDHYKVKVDSDWGGMPRMVAMIIDPRCAQLKALKKVVSKLEIEDSSIRIVNF